MNRFVALPFVFLAAGAAGCGSSTTMTTNATAPSNVRCQPALTTSAPSYGPSGGTGSVTVTVARECPWTANSSAPWIVLTSSKEGQGDGTVAYRIDQNEDPVSRRGSISVEAQAVQVAQDPAPCRFSVAPTSATAPATGGDLAIDVRTHTACNWTASTTASWASPSPSSGHGDSSIHVNVGSNQGPIREATLAIAGQIVVVAQEARVSPPGPPAPPPPAPPPAPPPPAPCSYQLSSSSASFASAAGSGSVRMRTTATCQWTARSNASWLTIADPASGSGDRDIRYTVAENFSPSNRTATITVATETHRVTQNGAEEVRLEGKVSALSGACPSLRFTVQNRLVRTDGDTEFRHGKCSDTKNGESVDVRGFRQADGSIDATRVEFDH